MKIINQATQAFSDQKPGTSGLRKSVTHFQQTHYLENFIQSLFNTLKVGKHTRILLGGDGRYYNDHVIQVVSSMAVANLIGELWIAQDGILSTPAASHMVRKYELDGAIILSASHNPGGPDGDLGIKYNGANGGPAPLDITDAVFAESKTITDYKIGNLKRPVDTSKLGEFQINDTEIQVVDSISDYVSLMEQTFDFDKMHEYLGQGNSLAFDAMHAVTGPYAKRIFIDKLGCSTDSVMNAIPLPDFGGGHPDPNIVYAKELVELMNSDDAPDLGAASDGDGDRNMILGKNSFVNPSDSLAIIVANADKIKGYSKGILGVARSMPTSHAVDIVAKELGINCYETPTGWKFFGNLLDSNNITFCGEESFGTSSNHVREKDGLWAVLFWLNLVAETNKPVHELLVEHWQQFGRHPYCRHDYEGLAIDNAQALVQALKEKLPSLAGEKFGQYTVSKADNFSYVDPIDESVAADQGIRIFFENQSRIVFRLSGTGTSGATLRVYLETYVKDNVEMGDTNNELLSELADISKQIADIKKFTARTEPDLIT